MTFSNWVCNDFRNPTSLQKLRAFPTIIAYDKWRSLHHEGPPKAWFPMTTQQLLTEGYIGLYKKVRK